MIKERKNHVAFLQEFEKKNKELFEKYPDMKYTFINIFNEGFSAGACWCGQ